MEIEQIEEIWDAESSVPPDQQTHMPMFVDALADEMVWHCRQVHLTPALARFEIKVLEAVLQWGTENPENFEHRSALEKELDQRKRGEDTFKPQREQVKPEPKPEPRAPLIEQPEDFVSGYETSSEEQNRLYGFGTFGMARTSHS